MGDDDFEEMRDKIREDFTDRELWLIRNCINHANDDPSGLLGRNLMIIISKMTEWSALDLLTVEYALGKMSTEEYADKLDENEYL